jgi:glucosamine--fructose-6-phosphate aminotransferase (isomerizing)
VKRLPHDLATALELDWSAALPLLAGASNLYVVGRGMGFGIAQEAALKLKEVAGLHAEALSAAELMHGPLALAGPDCPVLVFGQADAAERGLAELAHGLGARSVPVAVAGLALPGALALPTVVGIDPHAAPVALAQSFYPLAEAAARARGRDPDRPPHLSKVTETR